MRIIKNPKDFKKEITCASPFGERGWHKPKDYCGAILEVEEEDICYREYREDYCSLKSLIDFGVICPCCGCFVQIKEDEIPSHIKNNAKPYKWNTKNDSKEELK